jgi:hypothetical protein
MGIAISVFHDAFRKLPSAVHWQDPEPDKLPPERRMSWLVSLYPYLENSYVPLVKWDQPWDSPANFPPRGMRFFDRAPDEYRCPAWPAPKGVTPFATQYVGITGVGRNAAELRDDDPAAGAFGYRRTIGFKDLQRGRGNTMLVAETYTDNGPWSAGGWPTMRGLDPGGAAYIGPNAQFSSAHRAGLGGLIPPYTTHALFADGSVRSLNEHIDRAVFEAMAKIR